MKLIIMGIIGLLTVSVCYAGPSGTTKPKQIKPEVTESMRNKGRNFYKQLTEIRKEQDFKQYGFDGFKQSKHHEKYQKWMWDAYDLQSVCDQETQKIENIADRLQSELAEVCIAINYMNQMGQHYARNKGQDDKFTRKVGVQVKSALKIRR